MKGNIRYVLFVPEKELRWNHVNVYVGSSAVNKKAIIVRSLYDM